MTHGPASCAACASLAFARANPEVVILLIAENEGQVVPGAHLNLVPDTGFATPGLAPPLPDWRQRGVRRALVAEWARRPGNAIPPLGLDPAPESAFCAAAGEVLGLPIWGYRLG